MQRFDVAAERPSGDAFNGAVRFAGGLIVLLFAAFVAAGCASEAEPASLRHAERMPCRGDDCPAVEATNGACPCPNCDCPCRGGDASFCACKAGTCDCPCPHWECDGDSCRLIEGRPHSATTPGIESAAGVEAPVDFVGSPSGIDCPHELLAGDVPAKQRMWYRNRSNPGSCVQCSLGMCGVAQNVPAASLLVWQSDFGPPELHGSYPTRVADYARQRNMRIWNVTGPGTYAWMAWACRNGRPCAVGCNASHFQTLMGHDPEKGNWYVCDNNSPQRIDVYSDDEFRRRHRASGEWCVILDYPPGAPRPEYVAWWN